MTSYFGFVILVMLVARFYGAFKFVIKQKKPPTSPDRRMEGFVSRVTRIRTGDLYVPNVARYQLRYYPKKTAHSVEWALETGATGLEPVISGVTGQRDNQLR